MEYTQLVNKRLSEEDKKDPADFVLSDEEIGTSEINNSSSATQSNFMPHGHGHGHGMMGNEEFSELEDKWFEESQSVFRGLKWYRRPSKKLLFTVMSLHSISGTILMSPLIILMLKNICSSGSGGKPTHHHSMNMGPVGVPKYPIPATTSDDSTSAASHLLRLFARMDMSGGAGAECGNVNGQKILSNIQSILSLISGILGFTLSGKYGQWSDQYGRVFVFKIFSIINLVHTVSLLIYFDVYKSFNKPLLILFSSTGYLSGGIMTLLSNGNSYLNDIIEAKDRTIAISLLMSFVYSTVGFGPLLGSFVVKTSSGNNVLTLFVSLGFALVSTILVFTLMYESRHPEAMQLAKEVYSKRLNETLDMASNVIVRTLKRIYVTIIGFFKPMGRLWLPRTEYGSTIPRYNIISLILIDVFSMAATVGTFHVMSLWVVLRFHWTSVELGYFMSISGFGRAFVLLFVAPGLLKIMETKFRFKVYTDSIDTLDRFIIILSLVFVFLSNLLLVVVPKGGIVYFATVLQSLSGLLSPTIQSSVIKYSNKTEAGEMFGAIACVRHFAMLFLPTFFLQVYSHTVDDYPNFFLYIPMIGSLLTLILASTTLRIHHRVEGPEA